MKKITYNPDQLEAVAKLVWQHNPYLKNHPYVKSIDDVRSHMLRTTLVLVSDHLKTGTAMSMGYCVLISRHNKQLDECEVEFTYDPSVGIADRPFITVDADQLEHYHV